MVAGRPVVAAEEEEQQVKCDICGEGDYPDDPVVEYTGLVEPGKSLYGHIECAQSEGWEG